MNVAIGVSGTVLFLVAYKFFVAQGHPYLIGLFPVVLVAIFLDTLATIISLALTTVFIFVFEDYSQALWSRVLYSLVFILESSVVLWVIASRKHARYQLAQTLAQRNHEFNQLQKAHDKLARETTQHDKSIDDLRNSNRIMLETLERIINRSNRDY